MVADHVNNKMKFAHKTKKTTSTMQGSMMNPMTTMTSTMTLAEELANLYRAPMNLNIFKQTMKAFLKQTVQFGWLPRHKIHSSIFKSIVRISVILAFLQKDLTLAKHHVLPLQQHLVLSEKISQIT